MPKLIVKSTEFAPGEIELQPGINRFGRSPGSDHPLNHPAISELHCEIIVENNLVVVRDLGSTNGTFIDRRQIKESPLYAGQTLQIGPVEMTLEAEPAHVSIPQLPAFTPEITEPGMLPDGYPACLKHSTEHAVWKCSSCARLYCDECIRKLKRAGGGNLGICPACYQTCELSAWSLMMKEAKLKEEGYAPCVNHSTLHAVWECAHCAKVYCDECVNQRRSVGGSQLRYCPACNKSCKLSAWSLMVKNSKKSLFTSLTDKVKTGLKRTRLLAGPEPSTEPGEKSKRPKT